MLNFPLNKKPWVLEVNLSPSLATDAPLDLKIKSNVLADFFNLMGLEVTDPLSKRNKETRMNSNTPYAQPQKFKDVNSGNSAPSANQTPEDSKMVRWARDQYERRGGFVRIFPTATSWASYGGLLGTVSKYS